MVMTTTWVVSQRLVFSTAGIISMVSPLMARWWAMISVTKPMKPEATRPIPPLKTRSNMLPSATAPQPMKMADEYKLVTGGRPCRNMRNAQAQRMYGKSQHQQGEAGPPNRLGEIEPKNATEDDGGDIDDHAFVKWLDLIEEKLLAGRLQFRVKPVILQPGAIGPHGLVELGSLLLAENR